MKKVLITVAAATATLVTLWRMKNRPPLPPVPYYNY